MNTKVLIATVAGSVAAFLLGWLIYGIALMGYYSENVYTYEGLMIDPPKLGFIYASNVIYSLLLALLFSRMNGVTNIMQGAITGAWICILVALSMDLYFMSSMNWFKNNMVVVVDVLSNGVMGCIIGGVIAFVLNMGKPKSES